jgi:hypothetical protein
MCWGLLNLPIKLMTKYCGWLELRMPVKICLEVSAAYCTAHYLDNKFTFGFGHVLNFKITLAQKY